MRSFDRIITVKGTGRVSAVPDRVVLNLELESRKYQYDSMMQAAAEQVEVLGSALEKAGFKRTELKTVSFKIRTDYENYRDRDENYKKKFRGYVCEQALKLEFPFTGETMARAVSAIADAPVEPKLEISFTVSNMAALKDEVLIDAAKNARKKAEILTNASGAELGELIKIDYNWDEIRIRSSLRYDMDDCCMQMDCCAPEMHPDDIDIEDTVSFIWEIR